MSAEFPKQESVPVQEDKETKIARLRAELEALEKEGSEEQTVPQEIEGLKEEPAVSDQHAEEREVADASALAGVRERLGMTAGNESQRLLPSDMGEEDLKRIWKNFDKRQQEKENALDQRMWENHDKISKFMRPIREQIDTLLADKDSFPDTETLEQVSMISDVQLIRTLNKLKDQETLDRFGKAVLFLGEKGVLTDEIIAEGASIQDYEDTLSAEGKRIESGDGDPDYAYAQEYYRRESAR